jgi:hypothetical protein
MSAGRTGMEMRMAAINALTPVAQAFVSSGQDSDELSAIDVTTFALLEMAAMFAATAAGVAIEFADCEAHEVWAAAAFAELNDLASARKMRGRP